MDAPENTCWSQGNSQQSTLSIGSQNHLFSLGLRLVIGIQGLFWGKQPFVNIDDVRTIEHHASRTGKNKFAYTCRYCRSNDSFCAINVDFPVESWVVQTGWW